MTFTTNAKFVSPIASAIRHNNAASRHIESGNYQRGIYELKTALSLVKQAFLSFQRRDEYSSPRCREQVSTLELELCDCMNVEETNVRHCNQSKYVCIVPLKIRSETMNRCRDSYTRLFGIAVFNLALAHHLRAMQLKDTSSTTFHLGKSQYYYNEALSLQREENGTVDTMRVMANLNNLAHVHSLVQNKNDANRYWKKLLSMILYLNLSSSVTDDCRDAHFTGFVGNVAHLVLKCTESAPAA